MAKMNPFITNGYVSPVYFCDRRQETETLMRYVANGNNIALISPRRLGKTGLIEHCFHQQAIADDYHTFLIDIYATKNLQEFVFELGKSILNTLKSQGRKTWEFFLQCLSSLRTGISFDFSGTPVWNLEMGDVKTPAVTLDEIFRYLSHADRPCIIAIDEFQVIAKYPEKNVEALLRTHIQHCPNATVMGLNPIDLQSYTDFIQHHFKINGKDITDDTVETVYRRFEGITWYIQFMANSLYAMTASGETCTPDKVGIALSDILSQLNFTYSSLLFQLPPKQKEVLMAICKEGKAREITSSRFLKTYKLTASSVQGAIKGLLDKDFITSELGEYSVYDKFFEEWLRRQFT